MPFNKKLLCRCGCRGLCSYYELFSFIEWSVAACVSGKYPSRRHDGRPLQHNAALADTDLGFKGVVILIKADWAEFAGPLGFRSWGHYGHPCFNCFAKGGPAGYFRRHDNLSVLRFPFVMKKFIDYLRACEEAEVVVEIGNAEALKLVTRHLHEDRRKSGSSGRALKEDILVLGLRKGDRLEPDAVNRDVFAIDASTSFPMTLVFWRVSAEGLTRHRNPMFSARSYITPELSCSDELHSMHLGVCS